MKHFAAIAALLILAQPAFTQEKLPALFLDKSPPKTQASGLKIPDKLVKATAIVFFPKGDDWQSGSGVVVHKEKGYAYLLTNNHVTPHATKDIHVIFPNKTAFDAKVHKLHQTADLACIKFSDSSTLPFIELADTQLDAFEPIWQVGYPGRVGPNLNSGTNDGVTHPVGQERLVRASLVVNPGDSGSPVYRKKDGKIGGIISRKLGAIHALYVCHEDVVQFVQQCFPGKPCPPTQPPFGPQFGPQFQPKQYPPQKPAPAPDRIPEWKAQIDDKLKDLDDKITRNPPGQKGEKGDRGEQGPKGDTGDCGPKGETAKGCECKETKSCACKETKDCSCLLDGKPGPKGDSGPAGKDGKDSPKTGGLFGDVVAPLAIGAATGTGLGALIFTGLTRYLNGRRKKLDSPERRTRIEEIT